MSVEKRFLKFDELKTQVRVSSLTLSERDWKSRKDMSWRTRMYDTVAKKPARQILPRKAASADAMTHTQDGLKRRDNMAEDIDRMRYVRISPPPLDKVSRPKKILFEYKGINADSERAQSDLARRFLTRRDFVAHSTMPVREKAHQLNAYKVGVDVEVEPKFYQKWARNTRKKSYIGDTYSFPSLSNPQKMKTLKKKRKNSRQLSGPKKHRHRVHSSGSLCSNENSCSNVVDASMNPKIEINGFTDEENDTETSQDVDDAVFGVDENRNVGYVHTTNALEYDFDVGEMACSDTDFIKNKHACTPVKNSETKNVHLIKESGVNQCSINPTLLTVDEDTVRSKGYPLFEPITHAGYTRIKVENEEGTTTENNANKGRRERQTTAPEVTLSRNIISTEVLNGVVSRLPLLENRLESPFRCRKETKSDQDKPAHYSYYPARPIYNDMKKRRDKITKIMAANMTSLEYRRCKTDFGLCFSSPTESRIPMKIATSSPKFSLPDNLFVDFETLRINAHMDKLKKSLTQLPQGPRDVFVNKTVSDSSKAVPTVSSMTNNRFKTVIVGTSVPE